MSLQYSPRITWCHVLPINVVSALIIPRYHAICFVQFARAPGRDGDGAGGGLMIVDRPPPVVVDGCELVLTPLGPAVDLVM